MHPSIPLICRSGLPGLMLSLLVSLSAGARPNIVFVFSDDHAVNAISAYPGGPFDKIAPTPNIDRIAREGLLFENSFCANSICGPSRATILTGKHSHLNGFLDNNSSVFDGQQQTFPQQLRDVGYHTAIVGKWHLHSHPVGFDHWEVLPGQGSYYNPDLIQMDGSRKRYPGHCNDVVTKLALEQLRTLSTHPGESRGEAAQPFMLMVQYKAPHRNWSPAIRHLQLFEGVTLPEPPTLFDDYAGRSRALAEHAMGIEGHLQWGHDMKFHGENLFPDQFQTGGGNREYNRMTPEQQEAWDAAYEPRNQRFIKDLQAGDLSDTDVVRWKYQRYLKDYLRSIRSMDEGIGDILTFLDTSDLATNTVVIYASDQGFYLGEHGWYDKRWMFEESFKMPFLVRWPSEIEPGTISRALIQNIDYAPTFLDLCGAAIPADMQGRSLLPLFRNAGRAPANWRDSLYYRYYGERTHHVAAHDGIRTDTHKLFYLPETDEYQLFDLVQDPQEMVSIHDDPAAADTLETLQSRLDDLRQYYRAHSALIPSDRNDLEWWKQRQADKNRLARKQGHDLLFIGDSITQGWEGPGRDVWEEFYSGRNALNLGFSGDRTEHVIWRLKNGNLKGQQKAQVAVVMIGTNNTGHGGQDPYETAEGVERILSILRARCPETRVLLLAVFPRGTTPTDPGRLINVSLNSRLANLADGDRVHYLDLSEVFLTRDGKLPEALMPDALHPNTPGYRLWAEAMEPTLVEWGI
jgi:N-acetylglucosamine-6-sulfatase